MLEDLIAVAPEDRRRPLRRQLKLPDAMAHATFDPSGDGNWAMEPDQQGVGSGGVAIVPPLD